MELTAKAGNSDYTFRDIREVMAKANEKKAGDSQAGIGAENGLERIAAKRVLSNLKIRDIRNHPAVPYEKDFVTQIIQEDIDETIYEKVKDWTIGELREWLLDEKTSGDEMLKCARELTSECIAAAYIADLMEQLLYKNTKK